MLVYGAAPPGGVGEEFKSHRDALCEIGRTALATPWSGPQAAGVDTTIELVDAKPAEALVQAAERTTPP